MHYRISATLPTKELHSPWLPIACLQARNFYLQNGVQLVILHTYPKVPKQEKRRDKRKTSHQGSVYSLSTELLYRHWPTPAPASETSHGQRMHPPDNVRVGQLLQQADLTYNHLLVHVVLVDLHHHHFTISSLGHLDPRLEQDIC